MRLHPGLDRCRPRSAAALALITFAVLVSGCGTTRTATLDSVQTVEPGPWPSAADYGTIRTAVAVRDEALFRERDWRRRAGVATLAAQTLLTVRVTPGPCAAYVGELYGNLRDLMDAYAGEDWRPLIRLVHGQPSLARACRYTPVDVAV
jgi:hypothetical protein